MSKSWVLHVAGATTIRMMYLLVLLVSLFSSHASFAAAPLMFAITPVIITIPASHRSATTVMTNPNNQTVNVQIEAFQWTQDPDGNDMLSPTHDLIVYPLIFTVRPHAERVIRIGSLAGVPAERTYRLIVKILPSISSEDSTKSAGLHILTKASIPVFLETRNPSTPHMAVTLDMQHGNLRLHVANKGKVHIPPQEINIHGFAADSSTPVMTGAARGWYLLPNIARIQNIPLPADKCKTISRIEVALRYGLHTTTQQITLPPNACTTT